MTHEAYMKCPICQSCGMPMQEEKLFGRNSDGSRSDAYCIYCCPEGEERMQGTLEEMINVCARIETQMGLQPDEETAKQRLAAYLPTLERWRK